jgi:hypothetical protein
VLGKWLQSPTAVAAAAEGSAPLACIEEATAGSTAGTEGACAQDISVCSCANS